MEKDAVEALDFVADRTMADENMKYVTYSAARYVVESQISGAIVECGVWRGGCSMLMALGLRNVQDENREIWLYDTFSGMTTPQQPDVFISTGESASTMLRNTPKMGNSMSEWTVWCLADESDVLHGMQTTGYPMELVRTIRGPVEETLPTNLPDKIAVARLDTDWYSSTKVELELLYDRISPGGVLILDDYDHWAGARRAADEFFAERGISPFLIRAGFGRIHLKCAD